MPERAFLDLENLRRLTRSLVEYSLLMVMELVAVEPGVAVLASATGSLVFWETTPGARELGWVVVVVEVVTEETALLVA